MNTLICPECRNRLKIGKKVFCDKCQRTYERNKHGIILFLDKTDSFYDGKFISVRLLSPRNFKGPLKLFWNLYRRISIDQYEYRFFSRCFKLVQKKIGSLTILDIGCGGGNELLIKHGTVTGIDLSYKSLLNALKIGYSECYLASVTNLPFPDESMDIVYSAHLLGHIPISLKEKAIQEIFRVTRKGGFSIHSIECDSDALFFRKAKKYPKLYQKYFLDMYGHYGLEFADKNFERFRKSGFKPLKEINDINKSYLRPIESYKVFFDNEYKYKEKYFWFLAKISKTLSINFGLRGITNFVFGIFAPLTKILAPISQRDSAKCLYFKP